MKKTFLFLFLFLLTSFSLNAQVIKDEKPVTQEQINNIEARMTAFRYAQQKSQKITFVSSLVYAIASATYMVKLTEYPTATPNLAMYIGGIGIFYGGVLYLDSYKYMNLKRKKKDIIWK